MPFALSSFGHVLTETSGATTDPDTDTMTLARPPHAATREANAVLALNDPLLAALIDADEADAEPEIERVIVSAVWPAVERIVARYTGPRGVLPRHEAEDVMAAVSLRLVDRLRRARATPADAIRNVAGYVSTLTYNVISDHLRRRFPQRTRLKNRLRYLLTHDARFDLWEAPDALACGLRAWSGSPDGLDNVPIDASAATRTMRNRDQPAHALQAVFHAVGRPLQFEALIDFAAALWQIVDLAPVDLTEKSVSHPAETTISKMERQEFLGALWREVQELRPMQRKALLLNLRDTSTVDVISLLVLTGTARFEDLAAALELSRESLSSLWDRLPLGDLEIAERLGITRQQVINLRKAARSRLHRRLRR